MSQNSCIEHPGSFIYVARRPEYIEVANQVDSRPLKNCIAELLAYFEYRTNGLLTSNVLPEDAWIVESETVLREVLLDAHTEKVIRKARLFLSNQGLVTVVKPKNSTDRSLRYRFEIEAVQQAVSSAKERIITHKLYKRNCGVRHAANRTDVQPSVFQQFDKAQSTVVVDPANRTDGQSSSSCHAANRTDVQPSVFQQFDKAQSTVVVDPANRTDASGESDISLYIKDRSINKDDRSIAVPEISIANADEPEPEPDAARDVTVLPPDVKEPLVQPSLTQDDLSPAAIKRSGKKIRGTQQFREVDIPEAVFDQFRHLYEALRLPHWQECKKLYERQYRVVLNVINDFGDIQAALTAYEQALNNMRLVPFFQDRNMAFGNLMTNGKIPIHADAYKHLQKQLAAGKPIDKGYRLSQPAQTFTDRVAHLKQLQERMQREKAGVAS